MRTGSPACAAHTSAGEGRALRAGPGGASAPLQLLALSRPACSPRHPMRHRAEWTMKYESYLHLVFLEICVQVITVIHISILPLRHCAKFHHVLQTLEVVIICLCAIRLS